MNSDSHRRLRELIGFYVIDRLDDADRVAIEHHLISCAVCRAEETQLRGIVSLLNLVDGRVIARGPFGLSGTHIRWVERGATCRGRPSRNR